MYQKLKISNSNTLIIWFGSHMVHKVSKMTKKLKINTCLGVVQATYVLCYKFIVNVKFRKVLAQKSYFACIIWSDLLKKSITRIKFPENKVLPKILPPEDPTDSLERYFITTIHYYICNKALGCLYGFVVAQCWSKLYFLKIWSLLLIFWAGQVKWYMQSSIFKLELFWIWCLHHNLITKHICRSYHP